MTIRTGFLLLLSILITSLTACGFPDADRAAAEFLDVEAEIKDEEELFRGIVWLDENHNGIREEVEATLEGVQVFLLDTNEGVIDSDQSDAEGEYTLRTTLVRNGYVIEFEAPEGYSFTLEGVGDEFHNSDVNGVGRTKVLSHGINGIDAGMFADPGENTDTSPLELDATAPPVVSFMPSNGTRQMTASFTNGTPDCAQASEFTDLFEITIAGEEVTALSLAEGFTYSGRINPDATFLVMDDGGFDETFEGKFNPDGSVEAVNTLTVDGCTTTWDVLFTPND